MWVCFMLTGSGLAFIVYPEALSLMPGSTAWAILFFSMLLLVGIDSQFGLVHTIFTAILDEYPQQLYKSRSAILLTICVIMYILGLPLVTQVSSGKPYFASSLIHRSAAYVVLCLLHLELIVHILIIFENKMFPN